MKLSKKQKNYLPLVPPIDKHFADMSKQEAQDYFNWFLSHIDERADYLRNKVSKGLGITINLIDDTLESMKPVWEWFLQVAEVEKIPKRDIDTIEKSMTGIPQNVRQRLIKQSSIRLDLFTEFVLKDIGMYVSSFFIKNYPGLEWIIKKELQRIMFM